MRRRALRWVLAGVAAGLSLVAVAAFVQSWAPGPVPGVRPENFTQLRRWSSTYPEARAVLGEPTKYLGSPGWEEVYWSGDDYEVMILFGKTGTAILGRAFHPSEQPARTGPLNPPQASEYLEGEESFLHRFRRRLPF
jgi:hypothetical protein